jgi:hypothetical protein
MISYGLRYTAWKGAAYFSTPASVNQWISDLFVQRAGSCSFKATGPSSHGEVDSLLYPSSPESLFVRYGDANFPPQGLSSFRRLSY